MPPKVAGRTGFKVKLASGKLLTVLNEAERDWFNRSRDDYLKQAKFTEHTDLMDLDRLLALELMIYRWTVWIAAGIDYDENATDDRELQRNIKLYSDQITKVKESMTLSKKARDDRAKAGNFADYLTDLKARAKEFGIHRETQLDKALELLNELFAVVSSFERSDNEEREKMGFPDEASVLAWIIETARPEYEAIDAHFRANQQRYWVREL
jgi:hypothetical protein